MSEVKRCRMCHVTKPLTDFWAKTKNPDGSMLTPRTYCIQCGRAKSRAERAHRRANPIEPPVRLPSGPLGEWVLECQRRDPYLTFHQVARWFEVDEAAVRRWVSGERSTVDLDTVDRAFCRLGDPGLLNELWPVAVAA